jgi:hypothetical protein
MAVEFIHGSHETILEFLFGCDADVAQDRARALVLPGSPVPSASGKSPPDMLPPHRSSLAAILP